jgi:hypothetical protein
MQHRDDDIFWEFVSSTLEAFKGSLQRSFRYDIPITEIIEAVIRKWGYNPNSRKMALVACHLAYSFADQIAEKFGFDPDFLPGRASCDIIIPAIRLAQPLDSSLIIIGLEVISDERIRRDTVKAAKAAKATESAGASDWVVVEVHDYGSCGSKTELRIPLRNKP